MGFWRQSQRIPLPAVTVPDIRVGIVSWNTAALLDRCLAALPAALGNLQAEVVVVDNASSDGSADRAADHAGVTVIRSAENLGYGRGMNAALEGTDAPVLLALNPDALAPPGSLEQLVKHLDADPGLGLVVPRLLNVDGSVQHTVYRFPSVAVGAAVGLLPARLHRGPVGRRFWLEGHAGHEQSGDIDWAIGAVHCMRASAAGDRPYSEAWFMYAEDLELCWRLRASGWRIRLEADIAVTHVGNAAGAQAWGSERTARWLDATYDWYADARGAGHARAWAAVNTLGVGVKLVANRALVAAKGRRSADAWSRTQQFRELLPLHARKLIRGARAPLTARQPPA
jgi:GT2 family glycosyltransferase